MPKLPRVKHIIVRLFYTIGDFDDDDVTEFSQWATAD